MQSTTLSSFTTADFSGSGVCAFCHSQLKDSAGNDVSIDSHWRSTMMANSARDPLWQAKIASEAARNPSFQEVIEEKCSRCHMGMARYQALTNGMPVKVLEPSGFVDPGNALHAAAMDGVSCTLCHQVQPAGLGTEATFTGQYFIDTSTSPPNRSAFGPFQNPFRNPMGMNPMEMMSGFSPQYGPHVMDSAFCGTCHTLYTPSIDASGNVLEKEFPEQMTYLEWEHAAGSGGKSCRDCHMPIAQGGVKISNRPMGNALTARSPFGRHHFVGANHFMVNLIKNNAQEIGATADAVHFDATLSRLDAQLESRTAALSLETTARDQKAKWLSFTLTVQNKTGHKFPTGIPARRAWLHVTVLDKNGRVIFESGKPQEDGSILGSNADLDALEFEPHRDVIRNRNQVQIYEPVMVDSEGTVTHTLLNAAAYVKDNRLLPAGFNKDTAPSDIAVVGHAVKDPNFVDGQDRVTYEVKVNDGPVTILAELLYQAVSFPFAQDLRKSMTGDDSELVDRFMAMHDGSDKMPKVIARVEESIP